MRVPTYYKLLFVHQGIISKRIDLGDFILHGNWTITAVYGHQVFHFPRFLLFNTRPNIPRNETETLQNKDIRNISKTSASVSSGFPNTRKLMKARGRRPSAFIVFECLETPMKRLIANKRKQKEQKKAKIT